MDRVGIIDYGSGNIHSIEKALKYVGAQTTVVLNLDEIEKCDKIILPGVGAFGNAVQKLTALGFKKKIRDIIKEQIPVLGICVGMQMLFDRSYEFGEHLGLGIISGSVSKINPSSHKGFKIKVPHIGWSEISPPAKAITQDWNDTILEGIDIATKFYFVHSYSAKPKDLDVRLAETIYGDEHLTAVVRSNNLYGVQFHPEKSGEAGLVVLKNFSEL